MSELNIIYIYIVEKWDFSRRNPTRFFIVLSRCFQNNVVVSDHVAFLYHSVSEPYLNLYILSFKAFQKKKRNKFGVLFQYEDYHSTLFGR